MHLNSVYRLRVLKLVPFESPSYIFNFKIRIIVFVKEMGDIGLTK